MDGALTIGGPWTAHITWRTPQELDAARLAAVIAGMTDERRPRPEKRGLKIFELSNRES